MAEYAKGHSLVLSSSMANDTHIPGTIRGHEGTIVMVDHGKFESMVPNITVKPQVVNGGLSLQVVSFTGMGFTLPRESVQSTLDAFTSRLTKQFPLGIHADNVQVTDNNVMGHFSTRNASIPPSNSDPCFANL